MKWRPGYQRLSLADKLYSTIELRFDGANTGAASNTPLRARVGSSTAFDGLPVVLQVDELVSESRSG